MSLTNYYSKLNYVTFAYYFLILSTATSIHGLCSDQFPLSLSATNIEEHTRLDFYFHDIQSGHSPAAIRIVKPLNKPVDSFGTIFIADDLLTEKPEASSKLVGRAQGIYAFASQHDSGLLMVLNFAFIEGMYKGSTLSILGRNPFMNAIREMPIVGGSGVFRYAEGHAFANTISFNPTTGDAVVQYNVSVLHY